jgi:hypothetical protein
MKRAAVAVVVGLFALTFMATGMGAAANGTAGAYPCSAPGNIPANPTGKAFTHAQLAKLWVAAGGPASAANVAAAIALAESGGNPANVNTSLGGPNVGPTGLWQIYGNPLPGDALDPLTNARMAVKKWQDAGMSFRPWTTYTGRTPRAREDVPQVPRQDDRREPGRRDRRMRCARQPRAPDGAVPYRADPLGARGGMRRRDHADRHPAPPDLRGRRVRLLRPRPLCGHKSAGA